MSTTVLITGGSRGIGRATAEKFLEEGHQVIATSTSGEFEYSHDNLITHKLDQSDSKSIHAFAKWLDTEGHKVDVLINNAGIMLDWTIGDIKMDLLRKTFEVNLFGLIDLTESILGSMKKDGLIISMSSGLGSLTADMGTLAPTYSITKTAVNMYTKKLQARIAESGLTAISYEPGWVKTDMGGADAPREVSGPAQDLYKLATQSPRPQGGLFYNTDGVREW